MSENNHKRENKQFPYRNERGDGLNVEGILQAQHAMREGIRTLVIELAERYGVPADALQNAVSGISVAPLPPDLSAEMRLAIARHATCCDNPSAEGRNPGRSAKPPKYTM
jgi:hypothetical protein